MGDRGKKLSQCGKQEEMKSHPPKNDTLFQNGSPQAEVDNRYSGACSLQSVSCSLQPAVSNLHFRI